MDDDVTLATPGWAALDSEPDAPVIQPADDIDLHFATVFRSRAGQKVLAWLREQTIERDDWIPGADASVGYFNAGRSNLVREIEARSKRGGRK